MLFLLAANASSICEKRWNWAAPLHPQSPHADFSVHSKRIHLSLATKPHGKASQSSRRCSRSGIKAQMPRWRQVFIHGSSAACPCVQANHHWKLPKPPFKNPTSTILLPVPFPCPLSSQFSPKTLRWDWGREKAMGAVWGYVGILWWPGPEGDVETQGGCWSLSRGWGGEPSVGGQRQRQVRRELLQGVGLEGELPSMWGWELTVSHYALEILASQINHHKWGLRRTTVLIGAENWNVLWT